MEFFHGKTNIDFMGRAALPAAIFSAVLSLVCMGSMIVRGFNFGIDFTGGVLIEAGYEQAPDLAVIREQLRGAGFAEAQVQNFGSTREVLVRLPPVEGAADDLAAQGGALGQEVIELLRQDGQQVELRRIEFVGPNVGEDLIERGVLAVLAALFLILLYVMFRFQWKFSVGAIVATLHDVIVVMGVFSIFGLQFDLSVLAAVLAVLGYSLNDTIVVFDRVRENLKKTRRGNTVEVLNTAINETLSRTVITHGTTSLVVLALLFFGGETLRGFSIAMMAGIVFGTYSSIYIATATTMWLKVTPADLAPPRKEEQVDEMP
jgi:preprotein translocase subunit SecF